MFARKDHFHAYRIAKIAKMSILTPMTLNMFRMLGRTCVVPALLAAAVAQSASSPNSPPVSYASISQVNQLLSRLEASSQTVQNDLARLRIDKWKTDAANKQEAQSNVESIQRNLQSALPEMIGHLRNSPESLASTFKLYRNLSALYDVFHSVVESAGAFGSKDEFQNLQNDLGAVDQSRRLFGDRMEDIATVKEAELARLRILQQSQAVPSGPPKKVIVDDSEAEKKPAKKKSAAAPPAKATATPGPAAPAASPGPAPSKTPQ